MSYYVFSRVIRGKVHTPKGKCQQHYFYKGFSLMFLSVYVATDGLFITSLMQTLKLMQDTKAASSRITKKKIKEAAGKR